MRFTIFNNKWKLLKNLPPYLKRAKLFAPQLWTSIARNCNLFSEVCKCERFFWSDHEFNGYITPLILFSIRSTNLLRLQHRFLASLILYLFLVFSTQHRHWIPWKVSICLIRCRRCCSLFGSCVVFGNKVLRHVARTTSTTTKRLNTHLAPWCTTNATP